MSGEAAPALHVVFSTSAAVDLARALEIAGRTEEVVAFGDDLSFGPIDPPDLTVRGAWIERELGWTDWEDLAPDVDAFWAKALANRRRIVWLSRRNTQEHCGFLEWLRRNDSRPFELVDLTDASLKKRADGGKIPSPVTALIGAHEFVSSRPWDLAKPPPEATLAEWSKLWGLLRHENAAFRILSPEGLHSAPIAAFDAAILAHVDDDWGKAALVVGRFLYDSAYESFSAGGVHQTSDHTAIARLKALADAGQIEMRGSVFDLQSCTVRRTP